MTDTSPPPTAASTPQALALEGPVHREDGVYLSALDLRRVQLARSRVDFWQERKLRLDAERRAVAAEHQIRLAQLQTHAGTADRESRSAELEYLTLMNTIGSRYEVDIARLAYDDRTGRITIEGASPAPAAEPDKSPPPQEG